MCNRRNKPIWQAAVLLSLVGGLGYTFYLYNVTTMDLEVVRLEADKYLKQQESLSSQLQVVYEHRARLERSLQKEKLDHKNTKSDFSKRQNAFLLNITRSKHEAMNRFNSLETQYNMVKAQAKEIETDFNRLQQQYSRLSSEHGLVVNEQKRNFQMYKEQKTNELLSLQEEVKTLKEQVVSLRTHLQSKSQETEQYKFSSSRALEASRIYQEKLKMLEEELASYKEMVKKTVTNKDWRTADKIHGDAVVGGFDRKRVAEQVRKRQHEESTTQSPTTDISNRRGRRSRQVDKQVKSLSDSDARPVDLGRTLDENVDKQNPNVSAVGDGKAKKDSDTADTAANVNAQNEGYTRYGNIPLKDSNEDKWIAPAENKTANRWSDIIKAAQQSYRESEGEKREEPNRAKNEEEKETGNERREAEIDGEQLKMEEDFGDQNDKPEVRPRVVGVDRLDLQKKQLNIGRGDRGKNDLQNQDNQKNMMDEKDEERVNEEDDGDGLSRESMNRHEEKLDKSYHHKQAAKSQRQTNSRERDAGVGKVAPIPAVQRQDKAQKQVGDEEDAGNIQNEQESDPDEEDPDDAGEEEDDDNSPHQRHNDDMAHDRSLKAAAAVQDVETDGDEQNAQQFKEI